MSVVQQQSKKRVSFGCDLRSDCVSDCDSGSLSPGLWDFHTDTSKTTPQTRLDDCLGDSEIRGERVLDAVGRVLDGSAFGTSTAGLLVTLPAAGEYRIEIEARTGAPGAYRLQAAAGAAATARLPSAAVSEGEPLSAPALLSQGGTALALWMERGSNSPVLMGSRNRSPDQDWQAAQALALAPGYSDALGLQARADATGQGWVMWNDGNGPVVARGPVAPGGAWPAPVALASATCRGADAQHLAVNASGQALAMWQRAGSIGVWCTRRFEGGVWLAEQVVDSTARFQVPGSTPVTSFPATLALTDAGRAVAVWQRNEFGGGLLSAQQDTATAAWTTPAVLISDTRAGGPAPWDKGLTRRWRFALNLQRLRGGLNRWRACPPALLRRASVRARAWRSGPRRAGRG